MNRLLKRQLKKHLGELFTSEELFQSDEFKRFISSISEAYDHGETERQILERTLDQNSRELNQANRKLLDQNQEISKLATTDGLTGLANRLVSQDTISHALKRAKEYGEMCALLFVDLDRFKIINDTLGHHIGDLLLKQVARRLNRCVRKTDTVARLGGDEFTILLTDITSETNACNVAQKVLSELSKPFWIEGHELMLTGSIGISTYPQGGDKVIDFVKNADTAMYQAKAMGRNTYQIYEPTMSDHALEKMTLESRLRRALERGEFFLEYQPQIDLTSGRIFGAEALMRWHNPSSGIISPSDFIPLAEETGQIVPIGKWLLDTACSQNAAWQQQGLPAVRMAVNISRSQLANPDFISSIDCALNNSGLNPKLLELEITESMIMHNADTVTETINSLKSRGITISIDDFGTGHSSLSLLKQFPIDTLKIDKSFVRDISTDPDDAAIVTAIIAMARSLKLAVIAEGTEHQGQIDFLTQQGCTRAQGFLFSRPLSSEKFATLLEKDGASQSNFPPKGNFQITG